jgi:hypothetical protein
MALEQFNDQESLSSVRTKINSAIDKVNALDTIAGTGDPDLTSLGGKVYGTKDVPLTGNITIDETGATLGGSVIIFHQASTKPTITSTTPLYYLGGEERYVADQVNIIALSYIGGVIMVAITSNTATEPVSSPGNTAPSDSADSYSVNENEILTVNAANGVLSNASDADGDTLTAELVTDVANGVLTLNSDGSFTYTPTADYFGTDSFIYKAFDGTDYGNNITVTLTVNEDVVVAFQAWTDTVADGAQYGNALSSYMPQAQNLTLTTGASGTSDADHWGGCLGPNNTMYSVPYEGTKVIKYDLATSAGTVIATTDAAISGTSIYKHKNAVLCWNGFIYSNSWYSPQLLRINTADDTVDGIGAGVGDLGGASEYSTICMAATGNLYMARYAAAAGIKVIPSADGTSDVVETFAMSHSGFEEAIAARNGKIYCIPSASQSTVGIIDPANSDAFSAMTGDTGSITYMGAAEASNGKIYAHGVGKILVIDTTNDTFYTLAETTNNGGHFIELMDGRMYLVPRGKYQGFFYLDTETDTVTANGSAGSTHSMYSAFMDADGNIVGVSLLADKINKYGNNSFGLGENFALSRFKNS